MYERFTDRARKVMQLANQEAQRYNHTYIATEHILLGLVKEGAGVAANVLKNLDIDVRKLRMEVEKIVQSGPSMVIMGRLPQTPRAKMVIEYAIEEARNLNHNYVGTEHLLLGLIREKESVAAQVLLNLGLKWNDVREEVLNMLGYPRPAKKNGDVVVRRIVVPSPDGERIQRLEQRLGNEGERIQSLERQLRILCLLLGGLIGALVGALLDGGIGAFRGWWIGAIVVLSGEIAAALAGGISGVLLAAAYLPTQIEWILAGLGGAIAGMFLSEMDSSPGSQGFLGFWRRR